MADDLIKKRRVRGGQRSSTKKLVAKTVEAISKLSSESPEKDVVWLKQSQGTLKEKVRILKELDEKIIDALSESKEENADELMAKEIEETDEVIAELERVLIQADGALSKIGEQSVHSTPTQLPEMNGALNNSQISSDSTGKIVRAKLPKLQLKNFGGKVCEWPEFWDSFSSSIDNNDQLSDVDKFAYLRGYLEGPAKSTIAGLSLTSTNYRCAIDLLKKRFDKKNAIQRTHVNKLIQLSPVFRERDTQRLRKLYDSCEAHNRALKSLGVNEESYSTIVVPAILEKMPEQFRLTITRGTNFVEWTMQEMLNAFEKELELREAHDSVATKTERDQAGKKTTAGQDSTTAAALVANQEKKSCAFCLKNHAHEECEGVKDPKTRKTLAMKYGRCFLCLVKGHRASNCSSKIKCRNCDRAHHVALCDAIQKDEKTDKNEHETNIVKNITSNVASPCNNLLAGTGGLVALQTARGVLKGKREAKVRVLFDAGSHRSFVTSHAASLVDPKGLRREFLGINTFGQKCTKAEQREVVELELKSVNGNNVLNIEAYVVPEICTVQNSHVELARKQYSHLENIWFSDVVKSQEELEIDVLIGADYLWSFQTGNTRKGKSGEPVAIQTELGWVLSGPLKGREVERTGVTQVNFVGQTMRWDSDSLESNIEKLWSFEGLGIVEKDKVHEHFLDGISFTGSRYSVQLPWKEDHDSLPDNYMNSQARMKGQLRRLKKEPELLKEYDRIIKEQAEQGIIEQVTSLEKADKVHYLPHQAVVRKDAVTTKVRIVYDASSKGSKSDTSLNDCLHVGPSLNPLLYSILIRFRENKVALVADIEQAFLNVEVNEKDRDCLRFLWVNDILNDDREVIIYRFCRVVFGLNSSPFLLNATLRHHVSKYNDLDPEFVLKVLESFYVDDLVSGEKSEEQALELYQKTKCRMAEGGFNLRKWLTNSKTLSEKIDEEERRVDKEECNDINDREETETYAKLSLGIKGSYSKCHKVLGQAWDNYKDEFKFEIFKIGEKAKMLSPTKRNLLSVLASLFDPLGIISPLVVVKQKLIGMRNLPGRHVRNGNFGVTI